MQMREAAEQVLFAGTLEEKLRLSPLDVSDEHPGPAILTPDGPGRPDELLIGEKGVRAPKGADTPSPSTKPPTHPST